MCPNAEERFDAHDEGRPLQTEQLDTIPALGRVKNFLFGRTQPPDWLTEAIRTVALDEDELRKEKTKALQVGTTRAPTTTDRTPDAPRPHPTRTLYSVASGWTTT